MQIGGLVISIFSLTKGMAEYQMDQMDPKSVLEGPKPISRTGLIGLLFLFFLPSIVPPCHIPQHVCFEANRTGYQCNDFATILRYLSSYSYSAFKLILFPENDNLQHNNCTLSGSNQTGKLFHASRQSNTYRLLTDLSIPHFILGGPSKTT